MLAASVASFIRKIGNVVIYLEQAVSIYPTAHCTHSVHGEREGGHHWWTAGVMLLLLLLLLLFSSGARIILLVEGGGHNHCPKVHLRRGVELLKAPHLSEKTCHPHRSCVPRVLSD